MKIHNKVEFDRQGHFTEEGMKYDKERNERIEKKSIKIVRFENQAVLYGIDKVLNEIRKHFKTKKVKEKQTCQML